MRRDADLGSEGPLAASLVSWDPFTMVKAVLFDLYETLVTSIDEDLVLPGPGVAERLAIPDVIFRQMWLESWEDRMTGRVDARDVFRRAAAAGGGITQEAVIEKLYAERLCRKASTLTSRDDEVFAMLLALRAAGAKVAVVSNCASEEIAAWDASALRIRLDASVFSCRLGCVKPDARIYLATCEALSVPPQACVFVGDGGSNELQGAVNVGMTAHRATWFLDRWPAWRRCRDDAEAARFPTLRTPSDVAALVDWCHTRETGP
jgi:putative hydrolase of the HAD superfamily